MLLTGAILETFQSLKDRSLKVVFTTQEPTPETLQNIAGLTQTFGYLAFKKDDFKQAEIDVIDNLKSDYEDTGKSKAQRLRAVFYKCWEQENVGYEVFDDYYNAKMEKLITHFKNTLD